MTVAISGVSLANISESFSRAFFASFVFPARMSFIKFTLRIQTTFLPPNRDSVAAAEIVSLHALTASSALLAEASIISLDISSATSAECSSNSFLALFDAIKSSSEVIK